MNMKSLRRGIMGALIGGLMATSTMTLPSVALAQEQVLRSAITSDLQILDPTATATATTVNHAYMIYDTLFGLDDKYVAQPQMVGDWSLSDDSLTYTFTLRDGLNFHDGNAVTAEDAVASIKRWAEIDGSAKLLMERTKDVRAVDEKTFQLELTEPYAHVLFSFAKPDGYPLFVMPAEIAKKASSEPITEVIGSGPFRFVRDEWVPGSKVVYVKNEDYQPRSEPAALYSGGKVVNFDRVEWHLYKDAQTALAALQNKEIDYWENPPMDLLPILKGVNGLDVVTHDPLGNMVILRPNHLHPPFNNPKAIEGLMYLVNQEDYLKAVTVDPELYRTCGAMFVCGSANESDAGNEAIVTHNPERAVELFKEAGWDGTKPIQMYLPSNRPDYHAITLVMADAFRKIGYAVDVQAADWATISQRTSNRGPVEEGGWSLWVLGTGGYTSSSPLTSLFSYTCEKAFKGWPCSEKVEQLRNEYIAAATDEEKKAKIDAMQTEMFDAGVFVPLGQLLAPAAKRADIVDFPKHAMPGGTLYWNVKRAN
jgi:peptide/nickel transport system substrate-binding protein